MKQHLHISSSRRSVYLRKAATHGRTIGDEEVAWSKKPSLASIGSSSSLTTCGGGRKRLVAVQFIDELVFEIQHCSGVLIDYLERRRMKLEGAFEDHAALLVRLLRLEVGATERSEGFQYAGSIVNQEALHSTLQSMITMEAKHRGVGTRSTLAVVRKRAAQIHEVKQATFCLRSEVDAYCRVLAEADYQERHLKEHPWDRRQRNQQFWKVFHERSRDDLRPLVLKEKAIAEETLGEAAWKAASAAWGPAIQEEDMRLTLAHGVAPPPLLDMSSSVSDWRLRSPSSYDAGRTSMMSTSPCSWSLSPSRLRSPRSPPHSALTMSLQKPIHRWWDLPLESPFSTLSRGPSRGGLRTASRHGRAARPASQMGGGKSSSLPSLHNKRIAEDRAALRTKLPPVALGKHRYLSECDAHINVPVPLKCVTGHSSRIEAAGRDLVDSELLAMAGALEEMQHIEEVDLRGNAMLTDRSFVPFLEGLLAQSFSSTLERLCLADCSHAGLATLDCTVTLLYSANQLQCLDLSRVQLGLRFQLPLCEAIGAHPRLESVSLADTGLSSREITKPCLARLFDSGTINKLDLGWNSFSSEHFACIGEHLVHNDALKTLLVSNCSASVGEAEPPVCSFLECLAHDRSLTRLDVSMNRIDFAAAHIIEDCLAQHMCLEEMDISNNPLGVLGMRSVLRLLCHKWTALRRLDTEGCYDGRGEAPNSNMRNAFSYTSTGGRYVLDLARVGHRSILRMLYKSCERLHLAREAAFTHLSYHSGLARRKGRKGPDAEPKEDYNHPIKDEQGFLMVANHGILSFTFVTDSAMEAIMRDKKEGDFTGFLESYFALVRCKPAWSKVIPMFARWQQLTGRWQNQLAYVKALSKDFYLTVPHLSVMCKSAEALTCDIMGTLFSCIPRGQATFYLCSMIFSSVRELLVTYKKMVPLLEFNAENPTGHYQLNLENPCSYAVVERLRLLDRWESILDCRHHRQDTSARGNRSHFRNEFHQGRPLYPAYSAVADWSPPEVSFFECDYISSQRPPATAVSISGELWQDCMTALINSPCTPESKAAVLRAISPQIYIKSMNMRHLLGYFRTADQRAEIFVIFFTRILDIYNEKLFRARFTQEEVKRLQHRLGFGACFPFLQPEGTQFTLNLHFHDQRLAASYLLAVGLKENAGGNISALELVLPDGTSETFPMGIPRSWVNLAEVPREGMLTGSYKCAPEDRKFDFRRKCTETYSYFHVDVKEADVQWWTGLLEPPMDVLEFLQWLMSRFHSLEEAFSGIDGRDGNGLIILRELEACLERLNCVKFLGEDGKARIQAIFRYLDPGGEGSISKREFLVLDQLWKELALCITEFVVFLQLNFGDNMDDWWQNLNPDASGQLTMESWMEATDQIGFFGPSDIVFQFIDTDDDNLVGYEEFCTLITYKCRSRANSVDASFSDKCDRERDRQRRRSGGGISPSLTAGRVRGATPLQVP